MYHAVGTTLRNDTYGISIDTRRFEEHLLVLKSDPELEFKSLADSFDKNERTNIVLTFDDGYLDTLQVAAPLLVGLGLPFTVFVTSGFLRRGNPEYLTESDLRELASLPGVTIGSHTESHPRLTECNDAELRKELIGSKEHLEDCIGSSIDFISYPHGDVDARVRAETISSGYKLAAGSRFDINTADHDRMNLCRSEILARDTPRILLQKVYGAWDWYRYRHPIRDRSR